MDYSDRKLTKVDVWSIERTKYLEGTGVSGQLRLAVTNIDGDDEGPNVQLEIGTILEGEPTLKEAEIALISAGLKLIQRLALETPENIVKILSNKQPNELFNPSSKG